MQSTVESILGKGCFVIINDESVNACAMEKDGIPIIALYMGAIKKIICDASIMMLSEDFLTGVGDMAACYPNIHAADYAVKADQAEGSLEEMIISGDYCRELIGYMIANLAIHFIVYHEVGHHVCGHVKMLKDKYNLFYTEVSGTEITDEQLEERKQMELDADLYAAQLLMDVLDDSLQLTEKAFECYCSLMIASTEQTYADIFFGSYSPAIFHPDIKAINWFRYLYK